MHNLDFVDNENEEQCKDEKESTTTHKEDSHQTFNDGELKIHKI